MHQHNMFPKRNDFYKISAPEVLVDGKVSKASWVKAKICQNKRCRGTFQGAHFNSNWYSTFNEVWDVNQEMMLYQAALVRKKNNRSRVKETSRIYSNRHITCADKYKTYYTVHMM